MDDLIATTAEAVEADALPRLHEVHTDPEHKTPDAQMIAPSAGAKSPARWAYERLILYIKNFEEQLQDTEEAALAFTGADAGVLRIEGMGYFDPDIVTFYGTDPNGSKTQLIQHVSQLNVILRAMPSEESEGDVRRIGFRLAAELETDEA